MNTFKPLLVGIDAGREDTKVFTEINDQPVKFNFPSRIVPYYDNGGESPLVDENDVVIEILENGAISGPKFFVGEVTEFVKIPGANDQILDQEKATLQTKLFILNALYRLGALDNVPCYVGTGVPYQLFQDQKDKLKAQLEGRHTIRVYKRKGFVDVRTIYIPKLTVAAEGIMDFFDDPTDEEIGISNLGSVTHNYQIMKKKRVKPGYSGTEQWGCKNLPFGQSKDMKTIAQLLINDFKAKQWPENLKIRLVGGVADQTVQYVKQVYPYAYAAPDPQFAGARGIYKIVKAKHKDLIKA